MEENLKSILKVKIGEVWTDIPALRGYSVEYAGAEPTSRIVEHSSQSVVQSGIKFYLYDERKAKTDPAYQSDVITLWDGIDGIDGLNGQGAVNQVDGIRTPAGSDNVPLQAVSYGRVQTLNDTYQARARANINAQVAGSYITSPTLKNANEFLRYDGNNQWSTSNVSILPEGVDTGILVKSGSSMNTLSWMPAITNLEIDEILKD